MRWQDLERAYPTTPWPAAPAGDRVSVAKRQLDAALTQLARVALGLEPRTLERDVLVAALEEAATTRIVLRSATDPNPGVIALLAAHEQAWDIVAAATGGAMLPTRIQRKKTFPDSVGGLARHLAAAARARLPAANVLAAMTDLREQLGADRIDGRIAVIAARVFVRDLACASDIVDATKRWLAGEALAIEAAPTPRAVADGEDARVMIFERYQPELSDDAAIDRDLRAALPATSEPWSRDVETARRAFDEAVIRSFVARRPLPDGWDTAVDPIVAAWLGTPASPAITRRLGDLAVLAGRSMKLDRGWDEPVKALAFGKPDRVAALTGGGTLPAFAPGKFFKDDGRKLLRYLAAAILAGADAADVEPAWLDFLARRSPATTPMLERAQLRWWHLLAIQSAITHDLGKAPRETTGRALQRIVTGV